MDIIMMLSYAAIAIAAFKIFRLPVTKWTVTTTVLGGAFLMAWIYISMAFFHPYTPYARIYFPTSPISAQVRGKVVKVFAKTNQHLKKGDPLIQIDPTPFQAAVDRLKAELELEDRRLKETTELIKLNAGRKYDLERYESNIDSLKAQLVKAEFDLDSTMIRAPTDGHVTQSRVREGVMAGVFRMSSLMTYVIEEEPYYIAAFKPNAIQNIKVGAEAEVIFTSVPGKTFKAKVVKLWGEIAEGQLTPMGSKMMSVSKKLPPGRIPVQIELVDDISSYYIPKGSAFGVCVYSEHVKFLRELRRIFLHMYSWVNIISFDEPDK